LVKVVDISIEYLDEQLDGHSCVHARIGDTESSLQALEHALAIAI
jgi:hypothetical protein